MRPKNAALQAEILAQAGDMLREGGPEAINMRTLASRCGVSAGTVYLYYEGKGAILQALAEQFWRSAIEEMRTVVHTQPFADMLLEIYTFLYHKMDDFRATLLGGLRDGSNQHMRESMAREQSMQDVLAGALEALILSDTTIPSSTWNDAFTPGDLAGVVLVYMLAALEQHTENIQPFLEMVRRTLHPANQNKQ